MDTGKEGSEVLFGGNSLAVQWLGLSTFHCSGLGSIPGRRTKIPQEPCSKAKKKKGGLF